MESWCNKSEYNSAADLYFFMISYLQFVVAG